jgi:hypothetical protein
MLKTGSEGVMISDVDFAAASIMVNDTDTGAFFGSEMPGALEAQVDALALQAYAIIQKNYDIDPREYAIVIYLDKAGELRLSELYFGTNNLEAQMLGETSAFTEITYTEGMLAGQIVAIVHKHLITSSDKSEVLSRAPSAGDWKLFDDLVQSGLADKNELAHYIIAPDDKMREFDYSSLDTSKKEDSFDGKKLLWVDDGLK